MVEYNFSSNSYVSTQKIAEFISHFSPKVNFEIAESHFGIYIKCKFLNEVERDSFIYTLNTALDLSEDGSYIG